MINTPPLYIGIDPGRHGAAGWMCGEFVGVFLIQPKGRGIDVDTFEADLAEVIGCFEESPLQVAVEWPVAAQTWGGLARPGMADAAMKLALQAGQIDGVVQQFHPRRVEHVFPNVWKGRLGLAGKIDDAKSAQGRKFFSLYYPDHMHLITRTG